jgi:hypothetical protein
MLTNWPIKRGDANPANLDAFLMRGAANLYAVLMS